MSSSWWHPHKLVATLLVAAVVAALAAGAIGFSYVEAQLLKQAGETLSLTAADVAHKLDLLLVERHGDLQVMAEALAPVLDDSDRTLRFLSAMKQAYPLYLWLSLADPQGRVLVATDPSTVGTQLDATWLSFLRDGATVHIADVAPYDAAGGINAVAFTAPVRGAQGEVLGFASTRVALPALEAVVTRTLQEFQMRHGLFGTLEYQVLTHQGDVFIDSDLSVKGNVSLDRVNLPSARLSQSGHPGFVEETHARRNVPVVTGYAMTRDPDQLHGLRWRVLVRVDRQDLLAPVHAILRKLGVIVACVFVPLLFALLWMGQRLSAEWAKARVRERAVDATSKGLFITDARRPHHPILFVNLAFLALTRYSADEVLGLSPGFLAGPETDPVATEKLAMALRSSRPFRTVIRHYRKDGTSFWNEVTLSPMRNDQGKVTEFIWVLADVSGRHEMEQALRRSEARLRALASQAPVGIFLTDPHGDCLFVNERWCELSGLTPQEASGQGWTKPLHPDDHDRVLQEWQGAISGAVPFSSDFRFQTVDGTARWLHGGATALKNEEGEVTGFIGTLFDLTERKRAEEDRRTFEAKMLHVQKMEAIGTLAGGIAHEFNNSLTTILGFSELALPKIPSDSKAHEQIKQVIAAGKRASELVVQLLTFSRQTEQAKRPLSLHLLLKEALKLLRPTLPASIRLREFITMTTAPVAADPTQIHQVLLNLWTNAEHAMRATGGTLEIRLDELQVCEGHSTDKDQPAPGRYVRLTVRDSGCGIPPEQKARIFDPFFTTKEIGEGNGMGLSVVHGIVTAHGGTIRVESQPEQGTSVEIYLPALMVHEPVKMIPDEPLPRGHECILFVEDDESLAQLGREVLDSLGYRSVVRTQAQEALQAFRLAPQRFDLVITDQSMPCMTGEALARELLKIRPDLPILVCSGSPQPVPKDEVQSFGIRGRLSKPLVRKDVAFAIRRTLDGPAMLDDHAPAGGLPVLIHSLEVEEHDAVSSRR